MNTLAADTDYSKSRLHVKELIIFEDFQCSPLSPAKATISAREGIWSAITPERVWVRQWKHPWMRKTARNPMNLTQIYLYIWHFWEKSIFVHLPYWFYGNFPRKSKNSFTASHLDFWSGFCASPPLKNPIKQYSQKSESGMFWGRIRG